MASRRVEKSDSITQEFWRQLAQRSCWEVSAAAQELGLSVRQLERLCQQELACSPRDYFQRDRMTTAAQQLDAGQPAMLVSNGQAATDKYFQWFNNPNDPDVPRNRI